MWHVGLEGRPSFPQKSWPSLGEGCRELLRCPLPPGFVTSGAPPTHGSRPKTWAIQAVMLPPRHLRVLKPPPKHLTGAGSLKHAVTPRAARPACQHSSRAPAPLPAPCERGAAGLFPSGWPSLPGSDFLCIAVTPLPGEPRLSLGSILRLIKTAARAGGRARTALGTGVGWMRSLSHAARPHGTEG